MKWVDDWGPTLHFHVETYTIRAALGKAHRELSTWEGRLNEGVDDGRPTFHCLNEGREPIHFLNKGRGRDEGIGQ